MAGALVKRIFCAAHNLDPASVYHVAIMPCYDKKLEATRPDFTVAVQESNVIVASEAAPARRHIEETDCVLATSEVHELLQQRHELLSQQPEAAMDPWPCAHSSDMSQLRGVRGGSGGFLEHSLRHAARKLFDMVR